MSSFPGNVVRKALVTAGVCTMPPLPGQVPVRPIRGDKKMYCWVDESPDEVSNKVRVNNTGGPTFGWLQPNGRLMRHHGLMVTVWHEDKDREDIAQSIYDATTTIKGVDVTWDGTVYHVQSVYATTDLLSLGEDVGKRRYMWSFNARMVMQFTESTPVG